MFGKNFQNDSNAGYFEVVLDGSTFNGFAPDEGEALRLARIEYGAGDVRNQNVRRVNAPPTPDVPPIPEPGLDLLPGQSVDVNTGEVLTPERIDQNKVADILGSDIVGPSPIGHGQLEGSVPPNPSGSETIGNTVQDVKPDEVDGKSEEDAKSDAQKAEDERKASESANTAPDLSSVLEAGISEAERIRRYIKLFPEQDNATVVTALGAQGFSVTSGQVTSARKTLK